MTDDGTLGSTGTPDPAVTTGDVEPPPIPARRSPRRVAAVVAAVVVIGAGVGVAVGLSGGNSGGSSTPASAVNSLLAAANHSDVLGALDALVPGERQAIEPGLMGLTQQLQRLHVLSSGADLSGVDGISLHFSNIKTLTHMLTPTLAAVTIKHGSVTASVNPPSLPLGSFDRGFVKGEPRQSPKTQPVSTGRSAIVTELIAGHWYVSLGFTIAADSLRDKGRSGAPPPLSEAIRAVGASSPEGAVTTFFDDSAALNVAGLIGDLPPGEMGALQRYAPLFLKGDGADIAHARARVHIQITELKFSTVSAPGGTLVKLDKLGLSGSFSGLTFSEKNGCFRIKSASINDRQCAGHGDIGRTSAEEKAARQIISALPADVRAFVVRLEHSHPSYGIVTVDEGGRWYVSPLETMLDNLDTTLSLPQPQDLVAIEKLVEDPAELHSLSRAIEQIERKDLGSLGLSGTSTSIASTTLS